MASLSKALAKITVSVSRCRRRFRDAGAGISTALTTVLLTAVTTSGSSHEKQVAKRTIGMFRGGSECCVPRRYGAFGWSQEYRF